MVDRDGCGFQVGFRPDACQARSSPRGLNELPKKPGKPVAIGAEAGIEPARSLPLQRLLRSSSLGNIMGHEFCREIAEAGPGCKASSGRSRDLAAVSQLRAEACGAGNVTKCSVFSLYRVGGNAVAQRALTFETQAGHRKSPVGRVLDTSPRTFGFAQEMARRLRMRYGEN